MIYVILNIYIIQPPFIINTISLFADSFQIWKQFDPNSMADSRETLLTAVNNKINIKSNYWIIDALESRGFSWIFFDQSSLWKAGLSWSIFFLLAICVPILSHLVFQCSTCDYNHRRPFDLIVQSSLSVFSAISFVSLSSFSRKYGLRRFLFLDKMSDVSDKVRHGYSDQLHVCFLEYFPITLNFLSIIEIPV